MTCSDRFKGTRMIEERSYLLLAFQYVEHNLSDFMREFHERAEYDAQIPKVVEHCGQR